MARSNHIKSVKPSKSATYDQGYYKPTNPDKYIGKDKRIIYRSGWELRVFKKCDLSPNIMKWGSEIIAIPYYNPVQKKIRNYYIDVYLEDNQGNKYAFEIKPVSKLGKYINGRIVFEPPKKPSKYASAKAKRSYMYNLKDYIVNRAKHEASTKFFGVRGIQYGFLTEHTIEKLF